MRWENKHVGRWRARSPHGGIRFSSFGSQWALCLRLTEKLEEQQPLRGEILPGFFFDEKYWTRMNYEVNNFDPKNCLDKWVHHKLTHQRH